jgi:hypothetical protein
MIRTLPCKAGSDSLLPQYSLQLFFRKTSELIKRKIRHKDSIDPKGVIVHEHRKFWEAAHPPKRVKNGGFLIIIFPATTSVFPSSAARPPQLPSTEGG